MSKTAAIGLWLNGAAFTGELIIVFIDRQSISKYVVIMVVCGAPLLLLHLAGLICGVVAKLRSRESEMIAHGSSLAIMAGLLGLLILSVLAFCAAWNAAH
jgi:hypothetical protein